MHVFESTARHTSLLSQNLFTYDLISCTCDECVTRQDSPRSVWYACHQLLVWQRHNKNVIQKIVNLLRHQFYDVACAIDRSYKLSGSNEVALRIFKINAPPSILDYSYMPKKRRNTKNTSL
jgi:hypothetical protein